MNLIKNYKSWLNEQKLLEANIGGKKWTAEEYQELKELQLKNLKDLVDIFKKNKVRFWIDCGTLLGIYRDKNIIDGDSDCDVGVFAEDITPELLNDLKDRLTVPSRMFYDTDKLLQHLDTDEYVKTKNLKFVLKENGKTKSFKNNEISCDIFFYFPHEDYHMFKYGGREQYIRTKSNYIKKLDSMQFKGINFKIPSSIEKYLEQLYGKEWKTPDPTFDYRESEPWCLFDLDGHYFYNFKTHQSEIKK